MFILKNFSVYRLRRLYTLPYIVCSDIADEHEQKWDERVDGEINRGGKKKKTNKIRRKKNAKER